ncbi:MAG: hypothetical protein ACNA71_05375 [Kiritimatiellia bacterium]
MATPITIKKRTVSVKRSPANPKPEAKEGPTIVADEQDATAETSDAPVFLAKPKPTGTTKGGTSTKATTVAAVFALIAFLMLLFVLLLQVTEFYDLQSLFPGPLLVGMTPVNTPW